eukprot:2845296-Prymnesium_polylepis.2
MESWPLSEIATAAQPPHTACAYLRYSYCPQRRPQVRRAAGAARQASRSRRPLLAAGHQGSSAAANRRDRIAALQFDEDRSVSHVENTDARAEQGSKADTLHGPR